MGAREAIMTLPDGCLAVLGEGGDRALYRATLEPLEPVSSVGSGDAFLAGFVAARYGGRDAEDCLRFAVACGAESTQHFGAGEVEQREVERLVPEVRLERSRRPQVDARRLDAALAPVLMSGVRPPPNLGSANGSRDRAGQEGPPRIRLR